MNSIIDPFELGYKKSFSVFSNLYFGFDSPTVFLPINQESDDLLLNDMNILDDDDIIYNNDSSSIRLDKIKLIEKNTPDKITSEEKRTITNKILTSFSGEERDRNQNKRKKHKHDKYSRDNIKRKIQVHYLKFLRDVINQIIKEILNKDIQFKSLSYKFAMKVDKDSFIKLKKTSLGNIFKKNVSPKYDKTSNVEIYEKITKESVVLKNILDKNFYLEFIDYFYSNKRIINLSKYGLDKVIILSNDIEFFEHLIKNNETDSLIGNKLYQNKLTKILEEEFIGPSKIFVCVKFK